MLKGLSARQAFVIMTCGALLAFFGCLGAASVLELDTSGSSDPNPLGGVVFLGGLLMFVSGFVAFTVGGVFLAMLVVQRIRRGGTGDTREPPVQ